MDATLAFLLFSSFSVFVVVLIAGAACAQYLRDRPRRTKA